MKSYTTKKLQKEITHVAPDGSEIRELVNRKHGGLAHCTLPVGTKSEAHHHKTVEELWYFLQGHGEVYRKQIQKIEGQSDVIYEDVVTVKPGTSLTIPTGIHFQFRNLGQEPLQFIITTMPCWPGPGEAVPVDDYW